MLRVLTKYVRLSGVETTDPKHAIDMALAERRWNQKDLARHIGANDTALSRTLSTRRLMDRRSLWGRAFDALGLEIVIRPKGGGK